MPIFGKNIISSAVFSTDAQNMQAKEHLFRYICRFLDEESQGFSHGDIVHLMKKVTFFRWNNFGLLKEDVLCLPYVPGFDGCGQFPAGIQYKYNREIVAKLYNV